jgi:hypothetical protein
MAYENSLYQMIRAGVPAGSNQLHMVGFSFPADAPIEEVDALMRECRDLSQVCGGVEAGILSWQVSPNLDPRKGFGWVEVGVFRDAESFIAFHAHSAHNEFSVRVAHFADGRAKLVVLDVPIDPALFLVPTS